MAEAAPAPPAPPALAAVAPDAQIWPQLRVLQQRRCAAHTVWARLFTNLIRGDMSGDQFEIAVSQTILNEFRDVSATVKRVADEAALADQRVSPLVQRWARDVQRHERAKYEATIGRQQLTIRHLTASVAHNPNCFLINRINSSDPARAIIVRRDMYDAADFDADDDEKDAGSSSGGGGGGGGHDAHAGHGCCSHDDDIAALEAKGNDCVAAEASVAAAVARLQRADAALIQLTEELQEAISDC